MQTTMIEPTCAVIEIPPYLTNWDFEDSVAIILRKIQKPCTPCYIDMARVKNVYSATFRLIMRIYEKASRMQSPCFIINVDEPVFNALISLKIDEKVTIVSDYLTAIDVLDEAIAV